MKQKIRHYYDKCFGQKFYFFIGWKREDFQSYVVKKYKVDFSENKYDGLTAMLENNNNRVILIWTSMPATTINGISILTHECFHAVGACFNIVGVKYEYTNDEPFAYLLSRLVKEALRK